MPTINIESTGLTDQDKRDAAEAALRISAGESLKPLPASIAHIVSQVLSAVASGSALTTKTKVSTTEAAEYLDVSRPYVVRLLNEGKIAYHMVGSHRRIYMKDLEAYKAYQDEVSYAALQALADQAQELGMGY